MKAGAMNRRIAIQTQSLSQDEFGQASQLWSTAYECWASIEIQTSQLLYQTAEFVSQVTYRITCRWTSSVVISPKQRIVYTELTTGAVHIYEIQAVLNTAQVNKQIILTAYEIDGSS